MMNQEMMERPKGIRLMALLHLVLAASGIFRIRSDLGAMKEVQRLRPMEEPGAPSSLTDAHAAYAQAASLYHMVDILAAGALAVLLIGAGFMLYRDKRQGRTLSIAYAISSLALRVGLTVWYVAAVHPKHAAFLTLLHGGNPLVAEAMPIPSTSGWWVGMVIFSLYPLWVWWYLQSSSRPLCFSGNRRAASAVTLAQPVPVV